MFKETEQEKIKWVVCGKHEDYLIKDLINFNDLTIESIRAINKANVLRNGHRLSKFLIKCVLEGFFITYERSEIGNNVRFIVKRNDNVESGVIYNYDYEGDKSSWVFGYANTEGVLLSERKRIEFRGVNNNTQDILNSMLEVRKLAKKV